MIRRYLKTIKYRRGTTGEIQASGYLPGKGECCINATTTEIFMGDGERMVRDLPVCGHLPDYLHDLYRINRSNEISGQG